MGIDYDVRMFYGWSLSGQEVWSWLQANDLLYEDGTIYRKPGAGIPDEYLSYEPWPEGVELGHASPYFDTSYENCNFCVNVLARSGYHYHCATTTLAELQAIPDERIEAARRAVLLIDPSHEAGQGAPPELWALPHIW